MNMMQCRLLLHDTKHKINNNNNVCDLSNSAIFIDLE